MTKADRIQRVFLGLVLMAINISNQNLADPSTSSIVAFFIQLEMLITGIVGWCPFYWSLSLRSKHPQSLPK